MRKQVIPALAASVLIVALGCESSSPSLGQGELAPEATEAAPGNPEANAAANTASENENGDNAAAEPAPENANENTGPRTFGEAPSERALVALAAIAEDPDTFNGQVVKTEGEIAAVCQRMGCWMEISEEGVPPIRVPMAGHSFFLPKDVAGQRALIEGTVALRELSEGERQHLEEEGALATANRLQITATGVVLR